jgi:hypothetical protein
MEKPYVNLYVFLTALGVFPVLVLSSDEVNSLTADDLTMLRDDLGATDAMLDQLRDLASAPGRALRCDFDRQAVREVDPVTGE